MIIVRRPTYLSASQFHQKHVRSQMRLPYNDAIMLKSMLDRLASPQYRRPTGLLGRYIGRKMVEQHAPENDWTIALLGVTPHDRIIEIGCGAGYAIEQLARAITPPAQTQGDRTAPAIAGVDFSETMISVARQRNASAVQAGRVDLQLADAAALPFENSGFHKAYSIHSIYFWPEPLKALGEIWRVLRPGGQIMITFQPKAAPEETGSKDFRPYSGVELSALLHVAGFRQIDIRDGRTATHRSNYTVVGIKPAKP